MPPPATSSSEKWKLTYWSSPLPPRNKLPSNISRIFISTTSGNLELLTAEPIKEADLSPKPPILFQHGGFGCAEMFLNFLEYFSRLGYPSYALSIRGHGHSWNPGYVRMTFLTTAHALASDVAGGVEYVRAQHSRDPILLGHSNGGGLAQMALDRGLAKVAGLVLLSGTPNFGGSEVQSNWIALDPSFFTRLLRDCLHPRSPLSSTKLVHSVFFSADFPLEQVPPFERLLSEYEAYLWPLSLTGRFVDTRRVLLACRGQVLIVGAEKDKLMNLRLMHQMATEYRKAAVDMDVDKKFDASGSSSRGIGEKTVGRSGHHVQNDLQWEDAAEMIHAWVESLTNCG